MNEKKRKLYIDPRTKLLLLVTIAMFVMGGIGGSRMLPCTIVLCFIPLFLLLIQREWKNSIIYVLLYGLGCGMQIMLIPIAEGILGMLLLTVCVVVTRILPGVMMGRYVIRTTKVSEFVAGMEKMHVTNKITIPLSVLFRFFPTIIEEYSAINDAMKMRDIRLGGKKALQMLEYRLIPMITCSVKIGEELSAAALTRGLGAPVKRTNICKIGFGVTDYCIFTICMIIYVFWITGFV
ncbi:MAG: energy-coupling factor transporter transmembrane protein EcfT [Lachnospiraceae bacterium]|nr:energy-coupling factor transporter transmembrane protein EcfT [Lachnospiraceae bacterium]